jgi:hypothetical protein
MCSSRDADAIEELLDKLIWKEFVQQEYGVLRLCRHCNFPQGTPHAKWCPAKGIDEEGDHAENQPPELPDIG